MKTSVKDIAMIAGCAVALLLVGGVVGRYTAPVNVKIKEVDRVVEKQTTIINQQIDIDALMKRIEDSAKKNNIKKTKETVKTPDGTVTTRETETDLSESTTHTDTDSSTKTKVDIKIVDDKLKLDEHLKETITSRARPSWSTGIQAGYLIPTLFGEDSGYNLTRQRGLFLQLNFDRRLFDVPFFGPLWGGVFGNTAGAVGIGLRLEY